MRLPTSSKIERAINCPASALLPQVDRSSVYSVDGTAKHHFFHAVRRAGREAALSQLPERLRAECERIDVTALPQTGEQEVTFAWNWKTGKGRKLGTALDRNYEAATEDEFAGTSDNAALVGNRVDVDDFKTGWKDVEADTWQLKANALFAARAYGCNEAKITVYTVRDGKVWPESVPLSSFDLDMIADELIGLARKLTTAKSPDELKLQEGQHCAYCPATLYCPAKQRAVATVAELAPYEKPGLVPVEEIGKAYAKTKSLQAFLKRVEEACLDMARVTPVPLPDGRVLKEIVKSKDSIDEEACFQVLREIVGEQRAAEAVERKLTKKRINEVFGDEAWKVIKQLKARGAITVEESMRVEEVKAV